VISLRAIEKCTPGFDGWYIEFVDLPRFGRPRDTGNVDAVGALIEGEGCLSQKKITQMLNICHETLKHILHDDLNMRKVNFK
jgi:hypothetical protein